MAVVKEGKAKIQAFQGKITKDLPVFYNPEMERQRNLTICVLTAFQKQAAKKLDICDPLAGSGVRGIRIKKEVRGIGRVVLNDVTSDAVKLIKKNIKLNKVKAEVYKKDARILLFENRVGFDFIDIDPFGSPVKYLESSAFALRHNSLFAATATDTGALAGSFPKTCFRRYGIRVCRTDFYKELGLRALITSIQQSFAQYNCSFTPLLSFTNHYFRVFGFVQKNKGCVDRNLKQIGYVSYCAKCLFREIDISKVCPECKSKLEFIGPLWLGQMQDNGFVENVGKESEDRNFKFRSFEEEGVPLYYDLAKVCGKYKLKSEKIEKVVEKLKKSGFKASRTNLYPTGIKTDADIKNLVDILKT
ncbi:MAG: tRNA (guanine(10)-N(2))-dimethyltransferase [Candidatus Aenigmarchaeota archaeon]|nr:tRNA (guanine(10)-N(2))-dimethyltransferase [Candidatus Aenigmarchaeota archaeon]